MTRAAGLLVGWGYPIVLSLALAWAVGNCAYVYLLLGGARAYRVEAAVLALLAALLPLLFLPPRGARAPVLLSRRGLAIVGAAATVAWAALHVYLIDYPFLSDDYVFLDVFRRVSDLNRQPGFFRPLFAFVFWSIRTVFGPWPVPFHVLGMALHAGSAALIYLLCRRLFAANGPAVLAGSLFLVNPLQLEAVLWISGLQELLWVFFVLAALACHVSTREVSAGRLMATAVLVACGLLSKEPAVCYILLLPAADLVFFRLKRGPLLGAAYALFAGELVAYLLARQYFKPLDTSYLVAPTRYFVKQFLVIPYELFVHPWNQAAVEVDRVTLTAVSVVVLLLLVYALWEGRRSSRVPAGAFIVLATTLPVHSYFYVASDLASSRYIYFAAAGWSIIVADLVSTPVVREKLFVAAALVLIVFGASSLYLNARPWLVARDVMHSLERAAETAGGIDRELDRWREAGPAGMAWKNGVPSTYQGVGMFINGYDEFRSIVEEKRRR